MCLRLDNAEPCIIYGAPPVLHIERGAPHERIYMAIPAIDHVTKVYSVITHRHSVLAQHHCRAGRYVQLQPLFVVLDIQGVEIRNVGHGVICQPVASVEF